MRRQAQPCAPGEPRACWRRRRYGRGRARPVALPTRWRRAGGPGGRRSQPEPPRERDAGPDRRAPGRAAAARASRRPGQQPPPRRQGQPPGYGGQRIEQHLPAARAAAGGGDAGRRPGPRAAAQDREPTCAQLERTVPARRRSQLDRADCYDQFLFSKTLRRTPRCVASQQRGRERRASGSPISTRQRRQIMGTRRPLLPGRHHPRAGPQRLRPAVRSRRRAGATRRNPFSIAVAATRRARPARHRPTSSATCPSPPIARCACACATATTSRSASRRCPTTSSATAELCQSQCAAPAELYYHQNPGGAVEQMVSVEQPAALYQPEDRPSATARSTCRAARARQPSTSRSRPATDKKAEAPRPTPPASRLDGAPPYPR